jgi:hypothetical protein
MLIQVITIAIPTAQTTALAMANQVAETVLHRL